MTKVTVERNEARVRGGYAALTRVVNFVGRKKKPSYSIGVPSFVVIGSPL